MVTQMNNSLYRKKATISLKKYRILTKNNSEKNAKLPIQTFLIIFIKGIARAKKLRPVVVNRPIKEDLFRSKSSNPVL